jgi:transposase
MHYMGIDHHKQYSHITVLDERGGVIKADRVGNTRREVRVFLLDLGGKVEGVIEAGYSHYTMMDLMESEGVSMKIAHPEQVKAIAKAKIKTDKRDSKILAHLLRSNLIPEVYCRDKENREAQRILRHRVTYVRMQTHVKNRIRAMLAKQREEVRQIVELEENLFTVSGLKLLRNLELVGRDQQMLKSLLETLDHFQGKIKLSDALVREILSTSEEARLISTLPGFGKFFSVLVSVEIADIHRFDTPEKLHSYAGLVPSTHASGDKLYHGKLVRRGNKWLRWAAVEAVWPAVKSDFDIRLYYQRRKKRKGANSAKVATARRLLTIIYRVLKEKRAYIPYKRKKYTAAFAHI